MAQGKKHNNNGFIAASIYVVTVKITSVYVFRYPASPAGYQLITKLTETVF